MTDTKVTALPEIGTIEDSDVFYAVDGVGGTPGSKRVSAENLRRYTATFYDRTAAEGVTPTNYHYEPGHAFRYGVIGDGVTDDSTALQTWLDCGETDLVLPGMNTSGSPAVYITTGMLVGSSSVVGSIRGEGYPTIRRQGVISGADNDAILVVYSNRIHISGIRFDGYGTTVNPADPTLYTDLALNSNVGSADNTTVQDNLNVITDCYFYDAPGSCIAGAGMQSALIQGNKFQEWRDHAVYPSGDSGTGQGLGSTVIVDSNIFWMTGTTSNGAVKCRNNVQKYVISNNIFEIGDERAIDIHGGVATGTDYVPLDVTVTGNTGECGIFAGIFSDTSSTQDDEAHFLFADNNMRCSDRVFYLGDSASSEFLGDLQVIGGSYHNTSGVFAAFLDCRFLDTASECQITLKGVKLKHYALLQSYFPNELNVSNCTFDQTYGAWVLHNSVTDDATVKTIRIDDNEFFRDTAGQGIFDINVNDSSSVYITNNHYKNSTSACTLRDFPLLLVFSGNTLENTSGIETIQGITSRVSDGVIIAEKNKCISTVGASTVPRLIEETANSGGTLLDSYNIYTLHNFFLDVTGGISNAGTQVTGFVGGNIIYAYGNYGSGSTMACSYPVANRSTFLPFLRITDDYTISNETADRSYDANASSTAELADVLATLIIDQGHGT